MLPYVRGRPPRRGSGDPVGGLRVGADTDPGHGHDRLDIAVVHALDDDRHVQAVVDQGIESEIRGIGAQLRTEVGQGPTRPVRMAGSERDADTRPARIRGHVLPPRDAALHLGDDAVRTSRSAAATHSSTPRPSRLGGEDRRERGGRGRVRILVGGHVDAVGTRPLQQGDRRPARPQTTRAPHLRCEICSRAPAPPASRAERTVAIDSASEANNPAPSFRMCVAMTTASSGRADQCHELVRVCVDPRRVDEPRGQAERAGLERGLDLANHRRPLRLGWRRLRPHHGPAHRPVPYEERDVQPERLGRDGVQICIERPPARDQLVRSQGELDELRPASVIGASVSPQLPDSWVVNPCRR